MALLCRYWQVVSCRRRSEAGASRFPSPKKRPLRVGGAASPDFNSLNLTAPAIMLVVLPPFVPLVLPMAPLTIPVAVAMVIIAAVVANDGAVVAHECPLSRYPVAVRVVALNPLISRSRARRNIIRLSDVDTPLGRLGRGCRHSQSTCHHCRTQHPFRHAFHRTPPSHLTRALMTFKIGRRICPAVCGRLGCFCLATSPVMS